jgi:hypothetical protein
MVALQHVTTGVRVSVSDETAARLGAEWRAPRADTPDGTWRVAELRAYAAEHGIDVPEGAKKADILAAIGL